MKEKKNEDEEKLIGNVEIDFILQSATYSCLHTNWEHDHIRQMLHF